jgi:DNA-binding transcriptional MocR family regulator
MDTHHRIDWANSYADRAKLMRASEIREFLKLLDQPEIISFAGGIPEPALFPIEAIRAAYAAVLADPYEGPQALQYSVSEGYRPLRRWIAEHLTRLDAPCEVDNVIVTSGSQQALDFIGKLFLSPGRTALVTAPTYLGAIQAFNPYEPRYDILSLDSTGRTAASYRAAAAEAGGRVALAYAVPDFANPTGETLSEAARLHLLDLAEDLGIPLIEDAAYQALRFEGDPVPSCLALDVRRTGHIDRTRVIYCGTFSKTISPGLRIGWICAARELVHKVVLAKQAADLHSATLNQMVLHRVAQATHDDQMDRAIRTYSARRDAMLAALDRHMPEGVTWTRPQGGMFVWVTLPAGLDGADLLAAALAEERVGFVPGGAFFVDGSGANTIRLNFSLQPEAVIEDGIARLSRLVARRMAAEESARSVRVTFRPDRPKTSPVR